MLDLARCLDGASGAPLYQQIYESLSRQIREGRLRPGDRLPGKRAMAAQLAVAVNTVDTAYQMLVAEGYLEARPKSGFFVLAYTDLLPEAQTPPRREEPPEEALAAPRFDLSTGSVDTALFPFRTWGRIQKELLYARPELLGHGHRQGDEELRRELTGYLRAYWGVVLVFGIGAALQVRLIVITVVRFFRNRPEEKQLGERLEDEFISLTYLSGPAPDRRRQEVKKQLDQYSAVATGRFMGLFILITLAVMVLAWYGTVLFEDTPSSAPVAPQVHIPELRAELEQVESGQLETAEVWVHPRVDAGRLPGAWGSSYRSLVRSYHVVGFDTGGQWVEVFVPDAMGFSLDMKRPYRESQTILWNLGHARRYRISYTSNFHLVTEITPVD